MQDAAWFSPLFGNAEDIRRKVAETVCGLLGAFDRKPEFYPRVGRQSHPDAPCAPHIRARERALAVLRESFD
jgi:hypothetical protein